MIPDEPESDPLTDYIIGLFWQLEAGRRIVVSATAVVPCRISMPEISGVVEVIGEVMARPALDSIIFAMDGEYMESIKK
ncbi:hypothetical protein [Shewanella fodinae]|uniref:hypothetical protein n=1 Tax=Shewanella fodinae TaxID=552357 RepID=UPI00167C0029|nr:hypothetical protein [Shewanella fodinae]MCL2905233.1 hypothetical protein [Shewanella fodinae]GGY87599.1 hypothetical protein GCM10007169_00920 [Shewanella fodinae]